METEKMISIKNLCEHYELEVEFVRSLREYGLLEIIRNDEDDFIEVDSLADFELLMHLHYDLEINFQGVDAIYHLLKRVREMQKELNLLRNRQGNSPI